jgi:uncharacterized protein (DUF58 family)
MMRGTKMRFKKAVFNPRPMGILILLIIVLAFTGGAAKQELALALTGAVFLALWVYCLAMTLLLALICQRRARRAVIRISPREIVAGKQVEAAYSDAFSGKIVSLPGILIRCRLLLATKDGRRIHYDFKPAASPANKAAHFFTVEKRGAYFSVYDEFAVFDILGFFRFAYRLPVDDNARLLASPRVPEESPPPSARAGESTLQPEFSIQRTDNLTDHRPYVPGDDPRRINWKLYGHGSGLFVREGEFEPPPQSNLIIFIDTEYDPLLYGTAAALHGIDVLCENALAAALACAERGMEVFTGYAGDAIRGGKTAELASSLAWPFATPLPAFLPPPAAPDNSGILIFALPRSVSENSCLNRFLENIANRPVELLFFCNGTTGAATTGAAATGAAADGADSKRFAVAEACAALYNRRANVRAKVLMV